MASSINASVAGAGGLISTADNSGILNIQTASTTAVTVDASQNVGIGTAVPLAKLTVNGASNITSFTGTTRLGITTAGSTSTNDYSGIDFIGASTTTPTARIAVLSGSSGSSLQFGTSNAYASGITNTAMTIDHSGNVLIGLSSNVFDANTAIGMTYNPGVNYGISIRASTTSSGKAMNFRNPANGEVGNITTSNTSTSYVTSSDYRLKENIVPITGALDKVALLKPVTYTWKSDGSDGQGFIAHELQAVVPDCVSGEKDAVDEKGNPIHQGVDTSFLVATLTAAIQEQQTIINDLKARIEVLEGASN